MIMGFGVAPRRSMETMWSVLQRGAQQRREDQMSYNVFIDTPVQSLHINVKDAYEASAILNTVLDMGREYSVSADLWGAYVDNAMLTPALMDRCGGDVLGLFSVVN